MARVVQFMKSRTGKRMREKFESLSWEMYSYPRIWARGYCVSTVRMKEQAIPACVKPQEQEYKGQIEMDLGRGQKPLATAGGASLARPIS